MELERIEKAIKEQGTCEVLAEICGRIEALEQKLELHRTHESQQQELEDTP